MSVFPILWHLSSGRQYSELMADPSRRSSPWLSNFLLFFLLGPAPISLALLIYRLDSFNPAPLPPHGLTREVVAVPSTNSRMLRVSEFLGEGQLLAPEDIAYDAESGLIYTGCSDGWIKRVTLNDSVSDSVVVNWVYTGGRPLGVATGRDGQVIVADSDKGLLRLNKDGTLELLTDEADGLKFKLTDGVDVAEDGMIYFTDASYKYSFKEYIYDILEGNPNGRLMSYDPVTKQTRVLLRDLYFANGVAVSPDQTFVIYCETPIRRCGKYYIKGDREGSVEKFVESLPGLPDNIRYDGDGHYWIALSMEASASWFLMLEYPAIRKVMAMVQRYIGKMPQIDKNGGALAVNLKGEMVAHYYDPSLSLISSAVRIGNHVYCGSIVYPYIIRLDLHKQPTLLGSSTQ